jgi:hypothetical protein
MAKIKVTRFLLLTSKNMLNSHPAIYKSSNSLVIP